MVQEPHTISEASQLIRSGALTPCELLEQCLRRIDRYEPHVHAWVYLDRERARCEARRLTDTCDSLYLGPLHGIPIGIKDIIDVFDMPTGCGSALWKNSYARKDAEVVVRLRQAGAIILGKTVTTPYAFTDPPITRNPWNLDRTPGGSSSGSAAAVACGMCLGALGTQTGGSITRPASYCGVCSLKPTYDRVSTDGVLPLAESLDHIGLMARCVRDLAILYEAIASPVPACLSLIDDGPEELEFYRIADFFDQADHELIDHYRTALRSLGTIEVLALPKGFSDIPSAHLSLMSIEAASVHHERMKRNPNDYRPNIRELIETGIRQSGTDLKSSFKLRVLLKRHFRKKLQSHTVLITPATKDFPPSIETTGSPGFNSPWSFLGYPTVSVPAGYSTDGLPFAIQLIGRSDNESHLLASAAWAERQFNLPHRLPQVLA